MKAVSRLATVQRAPAPQRGLSKAIYEVIEANAGSSTFAEIIELLPAAIQTGEKPNRKKVYTTIRALQYRGYVIEDVTVDHESWKIAPLAFYEERQAFMLNRELGSSASRTRLREEVAKHSAEANAAAVAMAFAGGVLIGLALAAAVYWFIN